MRCRKSVLGNPEPVADAGVAAGTDRADYTAGIRRVADESLLGSGGNSDGRCVGRIGRARAERVHADGVARAAANQLHEQRCCVPGFLQLGLAVAAWAAHAAGAVDDHHDVPTGRRGPVTGPGRR